MHGASSKVFAVGFRVYGFEIHRIWGFQKLGLKFGSPVVRTQLYIGIHTPMYDEKPL